MRKSIFNGSIKDIAKALVKATNGKIKQTEALNILAKMDGFPSYNKECREFANYEQNIKVALQLKIEELQKEWESLWQNKVIGSKDNYIQRLFDVIESFFVFKDNSKISIIGEEDSAFDFFEDGFQYCVYRNLIDISLFRMFDTTYDYRMYDNINDIEQLKIYNTLQDTVYQEVPYINKSYQVFRGNLLKKHPSKIIDWFRKYFDLKYSGYSNKYDQEHSMINNYLSNINIDIKTSYKNQLFEPKEIEDYFVDIDYVISEHNIKIRLSYHFDTQYIMESFCSELFFSDNQANVKEYIVKELNDYNSSLYKQLCSEFGYNNHFGIYLVGVQFAKIDEEFELQISKYDKNIDGKFYQYYQQSCISESLLHPAKAFETSVNELTKNILKKQSYSKYICIEEGIKNNDGIDDSYNVICNDNEFNVYKDLTFSTYKYVFETLNNELVHIMNKTSKEVFTDIVVDIYERNNLIKKI